MKTKSFLLLLLFFTLKPWAADAQNPISYFPEAIRLPHIHGSAFDQRGWCNVETATQTITLSPGWNSISTYLEIELQDLKDALLVALPNAGANSIIIKSKSNGITTYNGSHWRGQLNSLDVAQMYKIKVDTDCEITLEGSLIDPSEHSITICYGNNWIGFPLSEDISLNDAFPELASRGDIVKSKTNGGIFNGSTWRGTLNTLAPGKGYIYKSTVQGNRIFTFPQ